MRRVTRLDLTVILAIIVCCAFLPLHLIGGGATILLCVSVACMALVVVITVIKRRWIMNDSRHQHHNIRVIQRSSSTSEKPSNQNPNLFHSIHQVDEENFWSSKPLSDKESLYEICSICLNVGGGSFRHSNCCQNVFHQECIQSLAFHNQESNLSCPICRTRVQLAIRTSTSV